MTNHTRLRAAFLVIAFCCLVTGSVIAQNVDADEPRTVGGSNNETTKAELDLLIQRAREEQANAVLSGTRPPSIILIARLGTGESSRKLNRLRLSSVKKYLEAVHDIRENEIVLAEGEPERGSGRVEAYLSGKLFMIFTLPRNKNFASEP